MSDKRSYRKRRVNPWIVVGVIILIILLLLWLTFADMMGDTDVAAFITNISTPLGGLFR